MSHPSTRQYLAVFAALAVLTAVEIGVVYLPGVGRGALVGALVLLAVTKAGLVGLFFMHLRSETRLLKASVAVPMLLPAVFATVLVAEAVWRQAP